MRGFLTGFTFGGIFVSLTVLSLGLDDFSDADSEGFVEEGFELVF